MRHLLRHIAQEHDIINETDKEKLTMEIVQKVLLWFKDHVERCSRAFDSVPFESPTDPGETLDFPKVIDTLMAAAFDREMDSTLKQGWINQMYD